MKSLKMIVVTGCLAVSVPAHAEIQATFQSGVVEVFGQSTFNSNSSRAMTSVPISAGTTMSTGSGSTSTGGVRGDVEYFLELIRLTETDRIRLNFTGSGVSQAMLGAGDSADVNISLATDEIGAMAGGSPIVMRFDSDTGPVPFQPVEATVVGNGSFRIDPPLTNGMIAPGDYHLIFNVGTSLFADQPGTFSDESTVRYSFDILVPEPSSLFLMFGTFAWMLFRRSCGSHEAMKHRR